MEWDVFISHATEDKSGFVIPLVNKLKQYGVKVWFDKFELKVGDSLSKNIDEGLRKSKYGIVIISKSFLNKGWTDYEYRSLLSREIGIARLFYQFGIILQRKRYNNIAYFYLIKWH